MSRRLLAATVGGCVAAASAAILLVLPNDSQSGLRSNSTPAATATPPVATRPRAAAVLEPAQPDSIPSPAAVHAVLAGTLADPALGGRVGASVIDLQTGTTVLDQQGGASFTPASTAKLLTAVAVLDLLGTDHRFETRVTWRPATGEVVLVGAGDPLLSRSQDPLFTSISTLATEAAETLRRQGVSSAAVRVDDSLFGPGLPPSWPPSYVSAGIVAPTSAIALDGGRGAPGAPRRDPATAAAEEFARLLQAAGVQPAGGVARTMSQPDDQIAATIESAPLADIVEYVVTTSDNEGAEVLGRHAALAAGQPATPDGVVTALRTTLTALGVDISDAQILDASGLSPAAKLRPDVLTSVLRIAASPRQPELRPTVTGLPIAAFTGTLADRYDDANERAGAGRVRAKTGTLTGASSLAGLTTAADGHTYVFAFLADAVGNTDAARDALDRAAAALSGCGCSS
jgi:D-alanyl-D-alanine carboxypeptidase/D-alanyl-D-alanine-endopeptidase (penicillin-binding protein 4)